MPALDLSHSATFKPSFPRVLGQPLTFPRKETPDSRVARVGLEWARDFSPLQPKTIHLQKWALQGSIRDSIESMSLRDLRLQEKGRSERDEEGGNLSEARGRRKVMRNCGKGIEGATTRM